MNDGHLDVSAVDASKAIPLSLLALVQEASTKWDICNSVGMPANLDYAAAHEWVLGHRGFMWTVGSDQADSLLGLYIARQLDSFETPEYEGYWEIAPLILPAYRGLGIVYRTIPVIHNHFRSIGVPGLHAFTWEKEHSGTRLWRKLGYTLLGRIWFNEGSIQGWKLIWAYPLSR